MFLMSISTTATVFVTDIYQLLVCRFLSGLGYVQPIIIILVMEYCTVEARAKSMVYTFYCWTAGGIFSILLAYAILPNMSDEIGWKVYVLGTSIPAWIVTITTFWLPESARWYSTKGEFKKAEKIILQVFEANGKEPIKGKLFQDKKSEKKLGNIKDIFVPKYRYASFVLLTTFFTSGLGYYGVAFISERLFEDYSLYISESITNLAEIPGASFGLLMSTVGWKWMTIYTKGIPGICCAIIAVLWYQVESESFIWAINVILVFLGRGLSWTSLMVISTYISVYYPTSIRATAVGLSVAAARLGAITAMFITEDMGIVNGAATLSIIAIVSCLLAMSLKDITIKDGLVSKVDSFKFRTKTTG